VNGLYFAYGSNLDKEDRIGWCRRTGHPDPLRRLGVRAFLPDHEYAFHYRSASRGGGALDVVRRRGALVEGLVHEVDAAGWDGLDAKEGAGTNYVRRAAQVILEDGSLADVHTYFVCRERVEPGLVPPTDGYLGAVTRGLLEHELGGRGNLEAAASGHPQTPLVNAVFVYGTLMRKECRHAILVQHEITESEPATGRGSLYDLGEYPALVLGAGRPIAVQGELHRARDIGALLATLDRVEGFVGYGSERSLYVRTLASVRGASRASRAWTYVMTQVPPEARELAGGDWRRRGDDSPAPLGE
jgi:gamma-glutamylcyclotransferase (GGCT)/AIG2-like uncharacterized protein YtfP